MTKAKRQCAWPLSFMGQICFPSIYRIHLTPVDQFYRADSSGFGLELNHIAFSVSSQPGGLAIFADDGLSVGLALKRR